MKTPFSVYLAGVLECIGGVLVLLMSAGMTYAAVALPLRQTAGAGRGAMLAAGCMYGLLGLLGLFTGIFLCRRKNWARWSTLIFSWITIFVCVSMAVFFLLVPLPVPDENTRGFMHVFKIASCGVCLLVAATCGWWAWLFTRPRITALYAEDASAMEDSRRPLSISIIGWLWMITGPMLIVMATTPMAIGVWVLTGWSAVAVKLVWGGAYFALGWGLLKQREWARQGSIVLILLGALNGLAFYALPGSAARLQMMMDRNTWKMQNAPSVAPMSTVIRASVACGLVLALLPLYFLIARKAAFTASGEDSGGGIAPPPVPPPSPSIGGD
jgi:hypothetical protein